MDYKTFCKKAAQAVHGKLDYKCEYILNPNNVNEVIGFLNDFGSNDFLLEMNGTNLCIGKYSEDANDWWLYENGDHGNGGGPDDQICHHRGTLRQCLNRLYNLQVRLLNERRSTHE